MKTYLYLSGEKILLFEKMLFLSIATFALVLFMGNKKSDVTPFPREIKRVKQAVAILPGRFDNLLMDGAVMVVGFYATTGCTGNDPVQLP